MLHCLRASRGVIGLTVFFMFVGVNPCRADNPGTCGWVNVPMSLNLGGEAWCVARFDDGRTSRLFVGGDFHVAGNPSLTNIAAWDGREWSQAGFLPPNGVVSSMVVFNDGTGDALYVSGSFTSAGGLPAGSIAKFDGQNWSPVGPVVPGQQGIASLAVFDDGGGPKLYACGGFSSIGGTAANKIARFNGDSWSPLGGGVTGDSQTHVSCMQAYDDGSGPALYIGGHFSTVDGMIIKGLARWNGTQWSSVGNVMVNNSVGRIYAMTVVDDGTGEALYVAGYINNIAGTSVHNIARWNGQAWTDVGGGTDAVGEIHDLASVETDSGALLIAGGDFIQAGGVPAGGIAQWNGSNWSALGSGMNYTIVSLYAETMGDSISVWAGGGFVIAGQVSASGIARWDGNIWHGLSGGLTATVTYSYNAPRISDIGEFNIGSEAGVYVSGSFIFLNELHCNSIARFDGQTWHPLGNGVWWGSSYAASISCLQPYDDGSGTALYVGGRFVRAGTVPALNIAKWDGVDWSAVGAGADGGVTSLCVYDDGSGEALYAGGWFDTMDGLSIKALAKWNGRQWSAVGTGLGAPNGDPIVYSLHVHDGALFVGGIFTTAGGVTCNNIARWDGQQWSSLAGGITGGQYGQYLWVTAMTSFDDGQGPSLFAGGSFLSAGGVPANNIARWDGNNWSPLGAGTAAVNDSTVRHFATYGPPGKPQLHVLGSFISAGGAPAPRAARWNGTNWYPLGAGTNDDIYDAVTSTVFGPESLVVVGDFTTAGGISSPSIARWQCRKSGDVDGDGAINFNDLLAVINAWGPCPLPPASCEADISPDGGDGAVTLNDLLEVLNNWGS